MTQMKKYTFAYYSKMDDEGYREILGIKEATCTVDLLDINQHIRMFFNQNERLKENTSIVMAYANWRDFVDKMTFLYDREKDEFIYDYCENISTQNISRNAVLFMKFKDGTSEVTCDLSSLKKGFASIDIFRPYIEWELELVLPAFPTADVLDLSFILPNYWTLGTKFLTKTYKAENGSTYMKLISKEKIMNAIMERAKTYFDEPLRFVRHEDSVHNLQYDFIVKIS